jgi:hypothetical protein
MVAAQQVTAEDGGESESAVDMFMQAEIERFDALRATILQAGEKHAYYQGGKRFNLFSFWVDALGAALLFAPVVQPQAHVAASACQEHAIRSCVHKPGVTRHVLRLGEGLRVIAALHRRAMRRAEREDEEDCAGQLGHIPLSNLIVAN